MDIRDFIDALGGPAAVGRLFGISGSAVSQWRSIPLDRCPALEAHSGRRIRCEHMRPDVTWKRDRRGRVTGYFTNLEPTQDQGVRDAA